MGSRAITRVCATGALQSLVKVEALNGLSLLVLEALKLRLKLVNGERVPLRKDGQGWRHKNEDLGQAWTTRN